MLKMNENQLNGKQDFLDDHENEDIQECKELIAALQDVVCVMGRDLTEYRKALNLLTQKVKTNEELLHSINSRVNEMEAK